MSSKISQLQNGNPLLPTDLIPIARPDENNPNVFTNVKVSASNVITGRKYVVLTCSSTQSFSSASYLNLNSKAGNSPEWYDTTGNIFAPGETGFYRLGGCFLYNNPAAAHSFGIRIERTNSVVSGNNGVWRIMQIDCPAPGSPPNSFGYIRFTFDEIIQIEHVEDKFRFNIACTPSISTIANGGGLYNRWHLIIEKL